MRFSFFGFDRERLTHLGPSEPLSRLSLFVIVLLDIFVLATLFQGLSSVADDITSPDERFPSLCRGVFNIGEYYSLGGYDSTQTNETETERRLRVVTDYADYNMRDYGDTTNVSPHAACAEVETAARSLRESNGFHAARDAISELERQRSLANSKISDLESSYSDSLLENIAGQPRDASILPSDAGSTRADIDTQRAAIASIEADIAARRASITALPEWTALWSIVDARSSEVRDAYASAEFWYPVLVLLAQIAFLVPVLVVAGLAYGWSLRRASGIAVLLSAHLLVVAVIPVFIKLVEFAIDLLPRHLFATILEWLDRYNIVVVFNYVLIVVAIVVTVGLVYFIQRKWFSLARLRAKRLEKGACTSCGRRLPHDAALARHCMHCGESQVVACDACGAETRRYAPHCGHCGATVESR